VPAVDASARSVVKSRGGDAMARRFRNRKIDMVQAPGGRNLRDVKEKLSELPSWNKMRSIRMHNRCTPQSLRVRTAKSAYGSCQTCPAENECIGGTMHSRVNDGMPHRHFSGGFSITTILDTTVHAMDTLV